MLNGESLVASQWMMQETQRGIRCPKLEVQAMVRLFRDLGFLGLLCGIYWS